WKRPAYEDDGRKFSQRYAFASSRNPELAMGRGILGAMKYDPLGSTFSQIYFGDPDQCFYVVWNDQFYDDPMPIKSSPWGHSKGALVWDANGNGFVLQVSTPSWPASGNQKFPRQHDGNTLGSVTDDDIEVSQHFFAFRVNASDIRAILQGMINASVVTMPKSRQVVNNGGPEEIQELVGQLGKKSTSTECLVSTLSNGMQLISKPSAMAVPPWQMVSAQLGGVDLRVASWWFKPAIYSTTRDTPVGCWDPSLGKPGAIEIATTGYWKDGKKELTLGLEGGEGTNKNHAKFGVSTSGRRPLCLFGDLNQQGALCEGYSSAKQKCSSSQNGRGGLFYVFSNRTLHSSMARLLSGQSAPTSPPGK
ncbi:MAG: hypothetical protein KDA96_04020, partial [Planctomycetaceae bacterium]|nr:hypothetical protein [Planctomycetaceae bacterium]